MDKNVVQPKMAWGITGSGHFLPACMNVLLGMQNVDVFVSKAAKEVLIYYGWYDRLKASGHAMIPDTSASCLPVTGLYTGKYNRVVIAPVTSNSMAKMAHGIADNLITNLFAHAGKCRIPTILLPCDSDGQMESVTPQGGKVAVHVREIDRENNERLASWHNVMLAGNPEQLSGYLKEFRPGDRG